MPVQSRRCLEQRVLGSPLAVALLARAGWRLYQELPPRSRLRRTMIRHVVQHGLDATNRRDFKTAFALYRPDVESVLPPELVAVGFEPLYRDREARIEAQRRWVAAWDDLQFRLDELIDLGARLVVVTRMKGTGLSSGATSEVDCVFIYTISAGRVVGEQFYFNRADAFKAVGLTE